MILIYRALVLGTKDEYVCGFYCYDECHKRHLMITNAMHGLSETRIDETTLSIHFENMLDSQGNKIFASLSEDGKGGDMLSVHQFVLELGQNLGVEENEKTFECVSLFKKEGMCFSINNCIEPYYAYSGLHEESFKVTGIQK